MKSLIEPDQIRLFYAFLSSSLTLGQRFLTVSKPSMMIELITKNEMKTNYQFAEFITYKDESKPAF